MEHAKTAYEDAFYQLQEKQNETFYQDWGQLTDELEELYLRALELERTE